MRVNTVYETGTKDQKNRLDFTFGTASSVKLPKLLKL